MHARITFLSGHGREAARTSPFALLWGRWTVTRINGGIDFERGETLEFTPDSNLVRSSDADDEEYQSNNKQIYLPESELVFHYQIKGARCAAPSPHGLGEAQARGRMTTGAARELLARGARLHAGLFDSRAKLFGPWALGPRLDPAPCGFRILERPELHEMLEGTVIAPGTQLIGKFDGASRIARRNRRHRRVCGGAALGLIQRLHPVDGRTLVGLNPDPRDLIAQQVANFPGSCFATMATTRCGSTWSSSGKRNVNAVSRCCGSLAINERSIASSSC